MGSFSVDDQDRVSDRGNSGILPLKHNPASEVRLKLVLLEIWVEVKSGDGWKIIMGADPLQIRGQSEITLELF